MSWASLVFAALVVGAAPDAVPDTFVPDLLMNILAVTLIALPIWDWQAAWKLTRAAWRRPRVEALTASAISSVATGIAATLAGILGLNRIYAVASGTPGFLPTWLALTLLAIALIVISIPNIYKVRLFTKWERNAKALKYHSRDNERLAHPHRRWDDPPVEGGPGGPVDLASGDRAGVRDPDSRESQ